MSLASIIQALFGIDISGDKTREASERAGWREAMHSSRNEATRSIATAVRAKRASDLAYETLDRAVREQERDSALRETVGEALKRMGN